LSVRVYDRKGYKKVVEMTVKVIEKIEKHASVGEQVI